MKTPVLRRRRLTNHVEVDTEGSWAISYGDMITLLLSFFILFFSTNKDRDRMNAMEDALFTVLSKPDRTPASASPAAAAEPKVEDKVRDELAAQVYKVGNRLIVEFPSVSFFHFGKVEVTKEGQKELEKFTKLFLPYAGNYVVGIRAFTDHKKVLRRTTARFQDNLELSALRSIASMRILQKLGIPLHRMRLGGYGELALTARELAATKKTPDADLALARKIVLVIEPESRGES